MQLVAELAHLNRNANIVNLDYSMHLCLRIRRTIDTILQTKLIQPSGILFLTVARSAQVYASPSSGLRRLARADTLDGVRRIIEYTFKREQVRTSILPGFPYEYIGHSRKECPMFSFGWRIDEYNALSF